MSYFALLAGPPLSVPRSPDRLPLRAPEELATGWALAWEQPDGTLVLPGDRLCVFRAPDSRTSITATPPVPGILRITVPDSEWLAAGSSVGELRYGPALETALERQEAAQQGAQQAAARAQGERQAEFACLQDQEERLARERDALHSRLQALQAAMHPPTDPSPVAGAAADLHQFAALLSDSAALTGCDPVLRLHGLLRWEKRLFAILLKSSAISPPLRRSRAVLAIQAQRALAELYREYIDVVRSNTHNFPDNIQTDRLGFWHQLRERHRDRLRRGGPAGHPEEENKR